MDTPALAAEAVAAHNARLAREVIASQDIIAFTRARLVDDEQAARAAQRWHPGPWDPADNTDSPLPGAVTLYDSRDESVGVIRGSYAANHIARYDPSRALLEVEAGRRLVDRYSRLLEERDRHEAAVAEWKAGVDHEARTGRWAGVGNPGSRSHALLREGDYLTAMIPVVRELVMAKAAVWSTHPDYLKEWTP